MHHDLLAMIAVALEDERDGELDPNPDGDKNHAYETAQAKGRQATDRHRRKSGRADSA
jgi:hypothetical protein